MKTKLLVLMAILLLIPFVSASAAPFTLEKVKKAGEIWLSGDGNFEVEGWAGANFLEGKRLSSLNQKPKVLHGEFDGKQGYYAIFKKNGSLKQWGELLLNDASEFSMRKMKKRLFNPHDWKWTVKDDRPRGDDPGEKPQGNDLEDKPRGDDQGEKPQGNDLEDKPRDDYSDNYEGDESDEVIVIGDLNGGQNDDPKTAPVPEPATMLLLGSGLIGLAGVARKKIKK